MLEFALLICSTICQIPELVDIVIDTEEDEEEEEIEKSEKSADKFQPQSLPMKMLDISQVKLRETKPAAVVRPNTSAEKKPVPSWMEELSKKQANRRSVGIFLDKENKVEQQAPKLSPTNSR